MKKTLLVLIVLMAAVAVAQAQVIQMKLGHFAAESHPGNLASKMFAEAVEKRTNGEIKITIYPNNALGSPPEVLEQNILGAVDMSLPTQGQLGKYSKKFNCVMLPFPSAATSRRTRSSTASSSPGRSRTWTRPAWFSSPTGSGASAT